MVYFKYVDMDANKLLYSRFKEVIPCMTLIKMNVKPVDGRVSLCLVLYIKDI